jgi:hypothetical protein
MVAMILQLAAIITITVIAMLIMDDGFPKQVSSINQAASNPITGFGAPVLTWAYLLTAIGLAFTSGRFVDTTAQRIRHAARVMHPTNPALIIMMLFSQCLLCAIGSAVISLSIPPDFLIMLVRKMGYANFAPLIWPAVFSLGISGFGATAHAAKIALL